MVRRIKKTVKGKPYKERKRIVVVGTEGDNKTEERYLRFIERKQSKYHFIFACGNDTDPVNIVRNTIKKAKEEELSLKTGDMAISLFDLDLDRSKEDQLIKAKGIAASKGIMIYSSNPCFEIWYLEHFRYSSKPFNSSSEVIRNLKRYIPEYNKNMSNYDVLYTKTQTAIKNCIQLELHHKETIMNSIAEFNNPQTEVYKFIQEIEKGDDINNR